MRGKPLFPFAITAIIGIVLMLSLSFIGLDHRADMNAGENEAEEEIVAFDDPVAAGDEIAHQSCIGCHGGDLSGAAGPALTSLDGKYSVEEIHDIIIKGKGGMPAMPLNDVEADAVAQYLLSISE
ncbi:cytochrome c [bacterium LRH843]|nr:cytochrome c [bacterium LRH843]